MRVIERVVEWGERGGYRVSWSYKGMVKRERGSNVWIGERLVNMSEEIRMRVVGEREREGGEYIHV